MAFTKINFANASPRGTGDNRLASVPAKARHFNDLVDHLTTNAVKVIGAGTTTLTAADSGTTVIFNAAGATNVVLPAPVTGMKFHFITAVTATADHAINAATNDHGFLGGVSIHSSAAGNSDSFAAATDGNNDFITMNGSTTGGHAGSYITLIATSSTSAAKVWAVTGMLLGSGTLATPFGDAQL